MSFSLAQKMLVAAKIIFNTTTVPFDLEDREDFFMLFGADTGPTQAHHEVLGPNSRFSYEGFSASMT